MRPDPLIVIDETLREGMQYQGLMFSADQRTAILDFQEALGIDICQAGYPPAHEQEAQIIQNLAAHARNSGYRIRVAGMGRAVKKDVDCLIQTRVRDFHLHLHIPSDADPAERAGRLKDLGDLAAYLRGKVANAVISAAMLDIGKSDTRLLEEAVTCCARHGIDIISLPDTSGIMAPGQVEQVISHLIPLAGTSLIAVHCHNDMGLASANTICGIQAGGRVIEAAVLGLGERNGIADLFTTLKTLKDQGVPTRVNIDDHETFLAYYQYVDAIVQEQLGRAKLTPDTPFFGSAVRTHVAGTHADGQFGSREETRFYLNSLCGRGLVKKYLAEHHIRVPADLLDTLTRSVKTESIRLNRRLTLEEVKKIIVLLSDSG